MNKGPSLQSSIESQPTLNLKLHQLPKGSCNMTCHAHIWYASDYLASSLLPQTRLLVLPPGWRWTPWRKIEGSILARSQVGWQKGLGGYGRGRILTFSLRAKDEAREEVPLRAFRTLSILICNSFLLAMCLITASSWSNAEKVRGRETSLWMKHLQAPDQGSRVAGDPRLMEDGSISIYPHRGK